MKNSNSRDQELHEAITKHTEQVLADRADSALDGFAYQLIFAVNEQNNVKITVRWPRDGSPAESVRAISSMLHHSSEGDWKMPMIAAVKRHGDENEEMEVANQIIHEWGQASQESAGEALCVPPSKVFARPTGAGPG
jgi:hypothetical protein